MNAFFNKVQNKLHEARISDVNHELGKVKENFINESSNYLNLIRSESAKFSQLLASGSSWTRSAPSSGTSSKLSSSTSLPAISPYQANPTSSKYKYKSSLASAQEESADDFDSFPEATAAARKLDESVVDRFIRVVETNPVQAKRSQPLASREEIRKKLAASFQETSNPSKSSSNDLQICFINEAVEAVSDDEDTERTRDEAKEDSSDDERTDPLAGRSDALDQQTTNPGLKRKLVKLQAEVQVNLGDCVQIAKRQVQKERVRRRNESPLKPLVGLYPDELVREKLSKLNISALQVIVNHCHSEIERLNEELVAALLTKDELSIEQDSQLLDIADLSHTLKDIAEAQ